MQVVLIDAAIYTYISAWQQFFFKRGHEFKREQRDEFMGRFGRREGKMENSYYILISKMLNITKNKIYTWKTWEFSQISSDDEGRKIRFCVRNSYQKIAFCPSCPRSPFWSQRASHRRVVKDRHTVNRLGAVDYFVHRSFLFQGNMQTEAASFRMYKLRTLRKGAFPWLLFLYSFHKYLRSHL